jgi:hypothetical protein
MSVNNGQTIASSWEAVVGSKPEDNIFDEYFLLDQLSQGKSFLSVNGGRTINGPIEYAVNTTVKSYSDTETLDTTRIDVFDEFTVNWKEYAGTVTISELEKAKNQGDGQKFALLPAKLENLRNSMRKALNEGCFSDGTGNSSKDIGGLLLVVPNDPTTGTFAGINRASFSFWRSQQTTDNGSSFNALRANMRTSYNNCSSGVNAKHPDYAVTSQTVFEGRLVWLDAFVSTARQVGKSVGLRELALWRMTATAHFGGEVQTVLHTGKDVASCREVQRLARAWAREHPDGWVTRESNGKEEIESPDGSRWLIRGKGSVYSYAATLALVDESWGVDASVVEDGIEPTLTEQENGQLVMFSTAHRRCTSLVPLRRGALLAGYDLEADPEEPPASLLLEWSAPRDADIADRSAWRLASPHWTRARERMLSNKLRRAMSGQSSDPDEDDPLESFRAQYLNVWPRRRWVASSSTEPLTDRDSWRHLTDIHAGAPADGPLVVAVDDYLGLRAAAAAVAPLPDGRLLVWGGEFDSPADAYAWASFTIGRRAGSRVILGRSLLVADAEDWLPDATVERASSAATGVGLPLLRSLIRAGKIAHSGDRALEDQVSTVGLSPTINGGLTQAHRGVRADLLHAVAWSVAATAQPADQPLEFYVY